MIESIRFAIGFEMRSHLVIATVAALLAVLTASGAQAQQGSVSNSRLMFDPNSVGTPTSQPQKLTPPATTTGQTAQQPAATRQTIAPQQQSRLIKTHPRWLRSGRRKPLKQATTRGSIRPNTIS